MKTGGIAGAVSVTQLSGNGHAACAHLKTDWITNSGGKHRQTYNIHTEHFSQLKQAIYLPLKMLTNTDVSTLVYLTFTVYAIPASSLHEDLIFTWC